MAGLKPSLVLIEWHDAHAEPDWMTLDEIPSEPYLVRTAGWLLPDAKPQHLVMAQSVAGDGSLDGVLCIPVGMVVRIVGLGNPPRASTD